MTSGPQWSPAHWSLRTPMTELSSPPDALQPSIHLQESPNSGNTRFAMGKSQSKLSSEELQELQKNTYCRSILVPLQLRSRKLTG